MAESFEKEREMSYQGLGCNKHWEMIMGHDRQIVEIATSLDLLAKSYSRTADLVITLDRAVNELGLKITTEKLSIMTELQPKLAELLARAKGNRDLIERNHDEFVNLLDDKKEGSFASRLKEMIDESEKGSLANRLASIELNTQNLGWMNTVFSGLGSKLGFFVFVLILIFLFMHLMEWVAPQAMSRFLFALFGLKSGGN